MASMICGTMTWLGIALSGCATPEVSTRAAMACVDDSAECVARRQGALKTLMADNQRTWVNDSPSVESYASGVRLYAFKQKKHDLSCAELQRGKTEADTAPAILRSPAAKSLTPAQASRGIMFAAEVSRELGNEMGRRCRRG
jgi:hypothetical protein